MKIYIASAGRIPSEYADSINTVKHGQGFYELGHKVKICSVKRFFEFMNKRKIKNIHKFYGISPKINFKFFNDKSFFFFNDIFSLFSNYLNRISWINNKVLEEFLDPERKMGEIGDIKKIPRTKYKFQNLRKSFYLSHNIDPERKISNFLMKSKIDFCYSRAYRVIFYNIHNKIPSVLECHESHIWKPELQLILKLANNKFFKGIVTISDILKDRFINGGFPEEKIFVHEDVVDLERFDRIKLKKKKLRRILNIPLDKKIVLYCGSLKSGKGINEILKTAKNFNDKLIFYIIGGRPTEIKYWNKKSKEINVNNVVFKGFIHNHYVPYFMKSADILFMPYDLKENYMTMDINTTSPLKIFEYMASKRPIVSSKIPAIEKIVSNGEEALLAEPNDIKQLANYISLLINNPKKSKKISQKAYKKVKNYTYKKRCYRIIQHFNF